MDIGTTKLLSIHVESMLPPTSRELDIAHSVQVGSHAKALLWLFRCVLFVMCPRVGVLIFKPDLIYAPVCYVDFYFDS